MSDQTPQPVPLNAQQLVEIQNRMISELRKVVDDVDLRKTAVEEASKIYQAMGASAPSDVAGLAKDLYAFMAEPMAKIEVKIS
jgi:hypothetical protein